MPAGSPEALGRWIAAAFAADQVRVAPPVRLPGGAIQENWGFEAEVTGGPRAGTIGLVLRTAAASGLPLGHGRAEEYALQHAAFAAGVAVPEPLALEPDGTVIGRPFYLMRRVAGTADPGLLVGDPTLDRHRPALAETIGRELARIHAITPPRSDLAFLGTAPRSPAARRIAQLVRQLDALPRPHPVLEWAVRWLGRNEPRSGRRSLGHGDFRCGNLMVEAAARPDVTVLDWEFASWTDPLEDVGWLCARCWRFGADHREVGGIGMWNDFRRGYESESGQPTDWERLPYWQVLATARWAIIALQQGERQPADDAASLELALTARKAAEMEHDLVAQIVRIAEAT